MAVNFNLLKNTFRPAGTTSVTKELFCNPTQEELSNLAEFIRMIGTSSKFAMKAHYELSGKNNNSSAFQALLDCEIEESSDEEWFESDEPMTFEEWLKKEGLKLNSDDLEFQALEELFNSMQHIEEIMQEEIDSHQTEMEYSECSYYPEYEQVTKALYTLVENIRKS